MILPLAFAIFNNFRLLSLAKHIQIDDVKTGEIDKHTTSPFLMKISSVVFIFDPCGH
jgi:hypothetical protein